MSECIYYCDGDGGVGLFISLIVLAMVCVGSMAVFVRDGAGFWEGLLYTFVILFMTGVVLVLVAVMLVNVPEIVLAIIVGFALCVIGWGFGKVLK